MSALADGTARNDIAEALTDTLFVEAGAGSGKTTELVGRVESLVRSGIPLANIAAITFTEKAATELRDRMRTRLALQANDASLDGIERDNCRAALDDIDAAAISTLHSFAQRLLSEHPIEARLPPGVEVLDEIGSDIEFDDRWRRFVDTVLDDPMLEGGLLVAWAAGVKFDHLRDIARAFDQNWDLVEARVPAHAPPPDLEGTAGLVWQLRAVADLRRYCDDPDNNLYVELEQLAELADSVAEADDPVEAFRLLFQAPVRAYRTKGVAKDWNDPDHPIADIRDAAEQATASRTAWCHSVTEEAVRQLAAAIGGFTLDQAERRRAEGRLNFHDLLVLARRLLRDPDHGHDVRVAAAGRYRRILLDEFQDTDPIQIELAVLLTSPPIHDDGDLPWHELSPEPGRLFFVGDPKQSIYRFRRADIGLYLDAATRFGRPPRTLTTNFRSTAAVLDWVNHVFSQVIEPVPGSQPRYEALTAHRTDGPKGAAVTLLGVDEAAESLRASDLRHREAGEVVAVIQAAMGEQWEVTGTDGTLRPARLGDICILLPARTSLPQLERALDGAGIPFRAEASALLYGSAEVRDLLAVLRAVDDPTDELALVTALRSAAFGCGDDDLYDFKVNHAGRLNHQAELPHSLPPDHPVGEGIAWFAGVHETRTWLTPSELIDRTLRERGFFEMAFAQGRFRDIWRRYRFVLDQARAYGDAAGGSLRDYLVWVERQAAEGSLVSETVLPETDDDAVRILTVHASKGLQFPITIVSGLTTQMSGRRSGIQVVFPPGSDDYGLKLTKDVTTQEFEMHKPLDEQMDHHERIRLLYVACTRAADHLVVSCHRKARKRPPSGSDKMTAAELIFQAAQGATWSTLAPTGASLEVAPVSKAAPIPDRESWTTIRRSALQEAGRPRVTSATAVARAGYESTDAGLAKEPRDLDLPPWRRGRYGTAVGRAVHGVLQAIDLQSGKRLAALSAAQAAAEGVDTQADVVESLARSALGSPVVVEAARAAHWKEVYVAAPVGDALLEGYVDLVFERGDGLVVVDYKTDLVVDDDHLVAKLERYRLQLGAYAFSVEAATGRSVVDGVFVFCDPDGAREAPIGDLSAVALAAAATVDEARVLGPLELE